MRSLFSKRLPSLFSLFVVFFALTLVSPANASTPTSTLTFANTCQGIVTTLVNTTDVPRDYYTGTMHDNVTGEGSNVLSIQPGLSWSSAPSGRYFTVSMWVEEDSLYTSRAQLGTSTWTAPAECPMAGGTSVVKWGPKMTKSTRRPTVTVRTVASSTQVGYILQGSIAPIFRNDFRSPSVYLIKLHYQRPGQKFCYSMQAYYSDGIITSYGKHTVPGTKCFRRPRR